MRKILLAIDAQNLKTGPIDFACYLAKLSGSKLTGVFLEDILYKELNQPYGLSSHPNEFKSLDEIAGLTEENIGFFREACEKRGVEALIHRRRKVPLEEMIEESRFSDLIIVDPETSFNNRRESPPTAFVRELLRYSECPVVISPENFEGIDEIIFTYDGNCSSALAIRQFTYLFPEFADKKIIVLTVNKEDGKDLRSKSKLSAWLKTHYRDFDFQALTGEPESELLKYLIDKKNLFLEMGSFGRGALSSFFRPSHATLILRTVNFPIFITHE